ncbi:hypothetical protein H5410_063885 [Solanum commersonii]|uniref:Uncharacterized protein n=1 Tax=Solanum commersonii TaxID=4109 RepID=A0A9J5WFJ2_SOLCO|nr:hypothetical protein H5410_063885 [Solanum commersonii]
MGDQISRGEELVKKAEKKLNGWGIFGSKYYDTTHLLHKILDHKHEAERAYDIDVAYYKMTKYFERGNIMSRESSTFISRHWKAKRDRGHYRILDTTFLGMRECKFQMGLAASFDKRDVAEVTSSVN